MFLNEKGDWEHRNKSDNEMISRSAKSIRQLGKKGLANACERLDASFDSGWGALLTPVGYLALLYIATRMRPNHDLRDLRFLAVMSTFLFHVM